MNGVNLPFHTSASASLTPLRSTKIFATRSKFCDSISPQTINVTGHRPLSFAHKQQEVTFVLQNRFYTATKRQFCRLKTVGANVAKRTSSLICSSVIVLVVSKIVAERANAFYR